jgi:hypothetical protein
MSVAGIVRHRSAAAHWREILRPPMRFAFRSRRGKMMALSGRHFYQKVTLEGDTVKRVGIIIGLASTLAGCVTAAQQQARQEEFQAAFMECVKANTKSVARMQCEIAADNRISGGETPLMAVEHAQLMKVALRVDKGEISREEGNVEAQQIIADTKLKAQQMDMQQAAINQAAMADFGNRLAVAGAYLQQAGAPPPSVVPPPPPPIPHQTRCSFWQNTAVCQ